MRKSLIICMLAAVPVTIAACGGDDSVNPGTSASTGGESSSSSSSGTTSSGSSSSSSGTIMPSPGADKIVINEMNGVGTSEWVEIVNTYDKAVSLEGYAIADTDAAAGGPDVPNAIRFPAGASIAPGEYLLVVRNAAAETPPVKHTGTACLPNAPANAVCYYMTWEISNSAGETIYFLSPSDQPVTSALYPAKALDSTLGDKSYARIPDTTGNFAATANDTPGSANMP